jgi:hypothetical protein
MPQKFNLICQKHRTPKYRRASDNGLVCRECGNERVRAYSKTEKGKEKAKLRRREWRKNTQKGREYTQRHRSRRAKTEEGREKLLARVKEWQKTPKGQAALARAAARNTPEKKAARKAVSHALEDGTLLKPDACTRCNSTRNVQAHHYLGYAPEHQLSVVWLCGPCHKRIDKLAPHDVVLVGLTVRQRRRILGAFLGLPLDARDGYREGAA